MTLVTGTVQDLGYDGMEGTLWARPARFRSDGSVVYAPERKPYKVVDGVVSADLAPGPAVLELQVGSHARGTFEVVIPEEDTTLADLLDTVFAWEPAQVSLFVAVRDAAVQAKADAEQAATLAGTAKTGAELAAQQTGQDRAHVDQVRTELDEAFDASTAGNVLPPRLTETALNATYARRTSDKRWLDSAVSIGSSTMNGIASRLSSRLTARSVDHSGDLAVGTWQISHTAMGVGTRPLAVAATTIPAGTGPVTLNLVNMPESNNDNIGVTLPGELAGVPGLLETAQWSQVWTFTRDEAGTQTPVPAGAEFQPTVLHGHERDVVFLNPGKNTITKEQPDWGIERILSMSESMAEHLGIADGRVLMIGHFVNQGVAPSSAERARINSFNTHFDERYGARFFDLAGYLGGDQVWEDTGLTPTQADADARADGVLPPSLSSNASHMNAAAYAAVADRLVERVSLLGWVPPMQTPTWESAAADSFDRADGPLSVTDTAGFEWIPVPDAPYMLHIAGGRTDNASGGVVSSALISPAPTSYRVSAEMPILGPDPGDRNIRIMLRVQDWRNYYYITPRRTNTQHGVALWRVVDNVGTLMAGTTQITPQSGDELAAEVFGETIRVYLNGTDLFTHNDWTFPTGSPGLYMGNTTPPSVSAFDEFRLDVPQGWTPPVGGTDPDPEPEPDPGEGDAPGAPAGWTVAATDGFSTEGELSTTETGNLTWEALPGFVNMVQAVGGLADNAAGGLISCAVVNPGQSDYRVSAEMPILGEDAGNRNVRIIARATDSSDFYFITPRFSSTVHGVSVWKVAGGTSTRIAQTQTAIPQAGDRLTAQFDGDQITVFLNDAEVLSLTDATHTTGVPGLYLGAQSPSVSAFDDFQIDLKD